MRDAKPHERYFGNQLSEELQKTTGQYILRRTKAQVLEDKHNSFNDSDKVFQFVIKWKVKFYRKEHDFKIEKFSHDENIPDGKVICLLEIMCQLFKTFSLLILCIEKVHLI